jgi:hypothetical protein
LNSYHSSVPLSPLRESHSGAPLLFKQLLATEASYFFVCSHGWRRKRLDTVMERLFLV